MSPDGKRFAAGTWAGRLEVWDLVEGRRLWQADQKGWVRALAYSPDGTRIIASRIATFAVGCHRHARIFTMTGHEADIKALAVSRDGRWIASGSDDGTVRVWTASTGQAVATLRGHDAAVLSVAFSPDSTRLISGGNDGAVRLWDVATHEPILVLQGHQGAVTSVAPTPDGTRILSGSADGTVWVWESRLVQDVDAALLVGRLRATLRFSADIMDRVRADSTVNPNVRTTALAVTEARGDDPSVLNQESWQAVRASGLVQGAYEVALRRALLANEAAPWNLPFIQTLGAAYYRLNRYEDCLRTMARAAGLRYPSGPSGRSEPGPSEIVFSAMAHHRLGHRDDARAALDQVRPMLSPRDVDQQALLEEATALIGR